MNSKRSTPQNKIPINGSSASKFHAKSSTPLDARLMPSSGSSFLQRHPSGPDVSGVGSTGPTLRKNLMVTTQFTDDDLECDFANIDYLQALLKKEIVEKSCKKHKEEINSQLMIQRDNLYKTQLAVKKAKEELEQLEKFNKLDQALNILSANCDKFNSLGTNFGMGSSLNELIDYLKCCCKKFYMKNIEPLDQEKFNELQEILSKNLNVFKRMNLRDRNLESVATVAQQVEMFEKNLNLLKEHQESLTSKQKSEVFKLLKSISDVYSDRENY